MKRDELNILADKYYSVMDISKEQKEKRKKAAWTLYDVFMLLFIWFSEAKEYGVENTSFLLPKFQHEIQRAVSEITPIDDYLLGYITLIAMAAYNTTREHLDNEYFLSDERAANLALNESNSILNHMELRQAIKAGYTMKIWRTELDNRVRPTHIVMEGVKIPINDLFKVGGYDMEMPHDMTHGADASEVSNCRCWLEYAKE